MHAFIIFEHLHNMSIHKIHQHKIKHLHNTRINDIRAFTLLNKITDKYITQKRYVIKSNTESKSGCSMFRPWFVSVLHFELFKRLIQFTLRH